MSSQCLVITYCVNLVLIHSWRNSTSYIELYLNYPSRARIPMMGSKSSPNTSPRWHASLTWTHNKQFLFPRWRVYLILVELVCWAKKIDKYLLPPVQCITIVCEPFFPVLGIQASSWTGGVCLGVLTVTRFVPGTQNGRLAVIEEQEKDKLRYCPWNLEVRGKERHCNQVRKLWYLNYPNPIQTLNILRQRYLQKDFNQMCGFEKWPKDMPIYFLLTLRWLRAKIDDLWWPSYIHCVTTC